MAVPLEPQRAIMNRVSRWLLLIGLGMPLVAVSASTAETPPAKTAKAAVERGNALLDKEDYPAAIAAFSEALRLDPKSVPACLGRGTGYRNLDKFDKALVDFNEALRLEPKNSEAHRGRGAVYGSKKDFANALAECDEAIRCDPKNSAAYRTRGNVHADIDELDRAITDYNQAIRLNPKDAWAYYDRAGAESNKGEIDKAIADFSEAIKIAPADYDARCGRGTAYRDKGEFDKAIADYSEATRLKPKDYNAFAARACAFALKSDFDRAHSDVEEVLRLNPQCVYAYCLRASIYEKKGDTRKAEADFAQAAQLQLKALLDEKGLAKNPVSKATIESVEQHIHAEVTRLRYSDTVAQELVVMVRDWNLAALAEQLAAARDQQRQSKLSQDQLAEAERNIAEIACQEIAAVVRYKEQVGELDDAIRSKCACCMGYALMFNVLGRSIGLDVQGLDVPITNSGPTIDDGGHAACLIHLADGRVAIVDAAGPFVSKPFQFAETYEEKGTYWQVKDARNPLSLHRVVQPLDDNGLVAVILLSRASTALEKGDANRAYAMVAEVLCRNPKSAGLRPPGFDSREYWSP